MERLFHIKHFTNRKQILEHLLFLDKQRTTCMPAPEKGTILKKKKNLLY